MTAEQRDSAQTLEALERSGARLRDLIEAVPAVIYESEPGPDAPWHYVSPQLQWLLGESPEEWLADPTSYARHLHPDDRDGVFHTEEHEFEIARGKDATYVSEYRMLHRDGSMVWVRDEARLMATESGRPFWRGVLVDISRERAANRALAETYERFSGERDDGSGGASGAAGDVFRLTCDSCGAIQAANRPGVCVACGSRDVRAESMNALLRQLEAARQEVDDLLDGIHRHLEMLGSSLHHGDESPGRSDRVITLLPDDDRLAG